MKPILAPRPYRIVPRFVRLARLTALGFVMIAGGFVYWTVKDGPEARSPIAVVLVGAAIVTLLFYLAFEQLRGLRHLRAVAASSTEQHLEVVSWKPTKSRGHVVGGTLRYKYTVGGRERVGVEPMRAGEEPYFTSPSRTHVAALVSDADPAHPWIMRADGKPFVVRPGAAIGATNR